jgi:hypothetical protein
LIFRRSTNAGQNLVKSTHSWGNKQNLTKKNINAAYAHLGMTACDADASLDMTGIWDFSDFLVSLANSRRPRVVLSLTRQVLGVKGGSSIFAFHPKSGILRFRAPP